jgi:hypothetical protein
LADLTAGLHQRDQGAAQIGMRSNKPSSFLLGGVVPQLDYKPASMTLGNMRAKGVQTLGVTLDPARDAK